MVRVPEENRNYNTCSLTKSRIIAPSTTHFNLPGPTMKDRNTQEVEEGTLNSAVQNILFMNTSFSDVELQGTDGERVLAHRTILAARSKVFETMLFGSFSEAVKPVIEVGYRGAALRSLIEYCYTDNVSLLDDTSESVLEAVATILELACAADYFGFPKLCTRITNWVTCKMEKNPTLAWTVLVSTDCDTSIWCNAMTIIGSRFKESILEPAAIPFLQHSLLETILTDKQVVAEEVEMFRFIQSWVKQPRDHDSLTEDNDTCHPTQKQKQDQQNETLTGDKQQEIACSMVEKYILLDRIKPVDLREIVQPSGLVKVDQLMEAYSNHCIRMETTVPHLSFKTSRGPCWETGATDPCQYSCTANSHCTELLKCNEMRSGIHTWSIQVVKVCKPTWLGVASTDPSENECQIKRDSFLGSQESGWVYGSDGVSFHANIRNTAYYDANIGNTEPLPPYTAGSVITLTLDLTKRGCLSASFDQQKEGFVLFENMLLNGEERLDRSFVPAVSLIAPGEVHFLGFHPPGTAWRTSV